MLELGDILLHVLFYAKIGTEQGHFTLQDSIDREPFVASFKINNFIDYNIYDYVRSNETSRP